MDTTLLETFHKSGRGLELRSWKGERALICEVQSTCAGIKPYSAFQDSQFSVLKFQSFHRRDGGQEGDLRRENGRILRVVVGRTPNRWELITMQESAPRKRGKVLSPLTRSWLRKDDANDQRRGRSGSFAPACAISHPWCVAICLALCTTEQICLPWPPAFCLKTCACMGQLSPEDLEGEQAPAKLPMLFQGNKKKQKMDEETATRSSTASQRMF